MAKTQWHPAFCAAVRLELKENKMLQFINEFNLTEKPLEVDMLIINKPSDMAIDNLLGEFFEEHNLLEYKSPTDHNFNQYSIFQALSYVYYYCDRYQTRDVTLSLIVSRAQFDLLKWLDGEKIAYSRRHQGIYTLHGISFVKVQIVVTEEIDSSTFQWLSALTDQLTETKAKDIVMKTYELQAMEEKRLADSVMQVLMRANRSVFDKIKGDKTMSEALMELMRPEVNKYAETYAEDQVKKRAIESAKIMLQYGSDIDYIQLVTHLTDQEITQLQQNI